MWHQDILAHTVSVSLCTAFNKDSFLSFLCLILFGVFVSIHFVIADLFKWSDEKSLISSTNYFSMKSCFYTVLVTKIRKKKYVHLSVNFEYRCTLCNWFCYIVPLCLSFFILKKEYSNQMYSIGLLRGLNNIFRT